MARCAFCNAIIVMGGRTVGGRTYCNTHHALLARDLERPDAATDLDGIRQALSELREDIVSLADEVRQQSALLAETAERVDFLERAVAQQRGQSPRQLP